MSAYFIANIQIHDLQMMKKYKEEIGDMVMRWGGEYLAAVNDPEVLEGDWDYTRLVLLRFPSEERLKEWYNSEEYQKVLQLRLGAAKCDTVFVKGIQQGI